MPGCLLAQRRDRGYSQDCITTTSPRRPGGPVQVAPVEGQTPLPATQVGELTGRAAAGGSAAGAEAEVAIAPRAAGGWRPVRRTAARRTCGAHECPRACRL